MCTIDQRPTGLSFDEAPLNTTFVVEKEANRSDIANSNNERDGETLAPLSQKAPATVRAGIAPNQRENNPSPAESQQSPESSRLMREVNATDIRSTSPPKTVPSTPSDEELITRYRPPLVASGLTQRMVPTSKQQPSGASGRPTSQRPYQSSSSSGTTKQKIGNPVEWIMKDRPKRDVRSAFMRNNMSVLAAPLEPTSYCDAVLGDQNEHWRAAIDEELRAHSKNGTWKIVPKTSDVKEMTAKWVFKVKDNTPDGKYHYKARLVARGLTTKKHSLQQSGWTVFAYYLPYVLNMTWSISSSILPQHSLMVTSPKNSTSSHQKVLKSQKATPVVSSRVCVA